MKPHQPVLLEPVLEVLKPQPHESYLDLTAGYGGHASAILELTQNYKDTVLVDRDQTAVDYLHEHIKNASIIHSDFYSATLSLLKCGKVFDIILLDLGVSSPQLDAAARGFSFREEGNLDMRMDKRDGINAEHVVNRYSERELTDVIIRYGEESPGLAAKIARAIVHARPLQTTTELAEIVRRQFPAYSKTHPATKTFQAIRIEVNRELELLEQVLPLLPRLMKPGGRVGIISFHSLEDRLVKNFIKDYSTGLEAKLKPITKHPIIASDSEIVNNPRSRSAKLRAAAAL
ncbi:16S rRNA (cytosine(1402)-N(4))-methyltransferase RsmH [Candidatus Saccharibacteria bacterium]|nr:16S rRNA (cytosine(1402)-N(4))-methyltransferase RsmH [Candidatus Saccharibacteria bacterium]